MTAVQTPIPSGTVITATGNTSALRVPTTVTTNVSLEVNATAVSGTTPSLTAKIQWSDDGVNFADPSTPDALSALTAVGGQVGVFSIKGQFYRVAYTVSGTTPSFTLQAQAFFQ